MPPNKIAHNLNAICNLIPEHADELLQRVDQPLEEAKCTDTGRAYLLCDYNRDGDSHRSPWSNKYDLPIDDGFVPSEKLRRLEVEANTLFDCYRELYFEGGTSSVYLWELDSDDFAGCFLIKKKVSGHEFVTEGCWDSIHVVEVNLEEGGKAANYKLTTTVILTMDVQKESVGDTNLSGTLTRPAEKSTIIAAAHTHLQAAVKVGEGLVGRPPLVPPDANGATVCATDPAGASQPPSAFCRLDAHAARRSAVSRTRTFSSSTFPQPGVL